jgi:CheY-like chemotaxis protein
MDVTLPPAREPGRRVLVIDDDPTQRFLLQRILEGVGCQVRTAEHGLQALELVAHEPPDLIILDRQMPVMDGPTFARAYAVTPPPHAPLIVVTGSQELLDPWPPPAPFAIFYKPVDLHDLLAAVQVALGSPSEGSQP